MPGTTDNSVFIDAPIDLVWKLTNDVRTWPELFTEYAKIDVLAESDNRVEFRLTMVPDPDGTVWSWVSERIWDAEKKTVFAQRIETGPFEYMKLYWDYTVENTGTRMRWRQEFEVKDSAPFDLEHITNRLNTNTVIQQNVIKQKIEAAGKAVA